MVYSKAEVNGRADEMSRLLVAVETGAPVAQENYEKYIQDAAAATRESMKVSFSLKSFYGHAHLNEIGFQHIRECNMWGLTIYRDLSRIQQPQTFIIGRCV